MWLAEKAEAVLKNSYPQIPLVRTMVLLVMSIRMPSPAAIESYVTIGLLLAVTGLVVIWNAAYADGGTTYSCFTKCFVPARWIAFFPSSNF